MRWWIPWLGLLACSPADKSTPGPDTGKAAPATTPWTATLPPASVLPAPAGFQWKRAILHLHSPFSHDACDGAGWDGTQLDTSCLDDLRAGLCSTRVDFAFLTDHPAHAAEQPFDALSHPVPGQAPLQREGVVAGATWPCPEGGVVTVLPGFEDDLMPVGLLRHVDEDPAERDRLLNAADAESVARLREAGATVLMAHTEQRDAEALAALQDAGLAGLEVFNLHAMFDPDLRAEAFGLEPFGWVSDIGPFTLPGGGAEPDLLFLAVHQAQGISEQRWDQLLARGPLVGFAGTDAHQNVLPTSLPDGERGDSYRRMLRWFSNHLLVRGPTAEDAVEALRAGRLVVAFEALGTPAGFDFWAEVDGSRREVGDAPAPVGSTLVVGCPRLAAGSPRGAEEPDLSVQILRDGQPWRQGCGRFPLEESGVYRVRVDITPHHLAPFLGEDADRWRRPFPWLYSNALRVGG